MHARAMQVAAVVMAAAGTISCGTGTQRAAGPTSATTSTPPTATPRPQRVSVTPATGLHNGQIVHVVATGYTPGQTGIGLVECGDNAAKTGPDDCNIAGIKTTAVAPGGTVTADFPVTSGPFGAKGIVCGPRQACVISVTQLRLTPDEFASSPISFG